MVLPFFIAADTNLLVTHFLSRYVEPENKATNSKGLSIVLKIIVLVSLYTFLGCVDGIN